jgi:hypothetical protein
VQGLSNSGAGNGTVPETWAWLLGARCAWSPLISLTKKTNANPPAPRSLTTLNLRSLTHTSDPMLTTSINALIPDQVHPILPSYPAAPACLFPFLYPSPPLGLLIVTLILLLCLPISSCHSSPSSESLLCLNPTQGSLPSLKVSQPSWILRETWQQKDQICKLVLVSRYRTWTAKRLQSASSLTNCTALPWWLTTNAQFNPPIRMTWFKRLTCKPARSGIHCSRRCLYGEFWDLWETQASEYHPSLFWMLIPCPASERLGIPLTVHISLQFTLSSCRLPAEWRGSDEFPARGMEVHVYLRTSYCIITYSVLCILFWRSMNTLVTKVNETNNLLAKRDKHIESAIFFLSHN